MPDAIDLNTAASKDVTNQAPIVVLREKLIQYRTKQTEAARSMKALGYRVMVLDPAAEGPAADVADKHIKADYDDKAGLIKLAEHTRAVTTEFENARVLLKSCKTVLQKKPLLLVWVCPSHPIGLCESQLIWIRHLRTCDVWYPGSGDLQVEPDWAAVLKLPRTSLHLYGKAEARRARKMGHINCTGATLADAVDTANHIVHLLKLPVQASVAIDQAVDVLLSGHLVAFPTETVYGLGADAENPEAVERIYQAKGRPSNHPVIVHVAPEADLSYWVAALPWQAQRLIDQFWPGPLTLILKRAAHIPQQGGIAAPSANKFGHVSPTHASHVREEFPEKLADGMPVLEGGASEVGIESTIIDLSRVDTGLGPVLLRPGFISAEQIEDVLGQAVLEPDAEAPRVSGALKSHYAPNTPLALASMAELTLLAQQLSPHDFSQRIALVAHSKPVNSMTENPQVDWIAASTDPVIYAHDLYMQLRALDKEGYARIVFEQVPDTPKVSDLFSDVTEKPVWSEHLGPGSVLLHAFALQAVDAVYSDVQQVIQQSKLRQMGYRYERLDPLTGLPWQPMPESLERLAKQAAEAAGYPGFEPDACLINRYDVGCKMSLHQDRNEKDYRWPVVSLSLGLPAIFMFGGDERSDKSDAVSRGEAGKTRRAPCVRTNTH
eukprot:gene11037-11120_t